MADGDLTFTRDEEGNVSYAPRAPQVPVGTSMGYGENLAKKMDQPTLDAISTSLTETVAFDQEGTSGWEQIAEEIHDLLGLGPEAQPDMDGDEGEDQSSHTLMLTALLRFQAKALSVMLPADDMAVRTEPAQDLDQIEDEDARDKEREAVTRAEKRVQAFYTDYLFKRLPSYEEDTDQILHDMGLTGVGVRKIVTDRSRQTMPVIPEYVEPGSLTVSYSSRNFRTGRLTHKINMDSGDLIRRIRSGMYRSVKLIDNQAPDVSPVTEARDRVHGLDPGHYQNSETHEISEVYGHFFLKADPHPKGLPRPYIITIHNYTREILAIQRNWDPNDPDEVPLEHFVAYLYHPGKNAITGVGIGQILMQVTRALRYGQRRGLEAAYLQNHPSGFKLSSMDIRDSDTKIRNGEFMDVDSPAGDIRSAIMLHPFEGPSPGLLSMMDKMEQNGRELGGIASFDFTQLMKAGVAAGPAMAAFEESTEFQTSVHRRLYKAHRKELEIIHHRMRIARGNQTTLFGVDQVLEPGDLQRVNILPYMKPGQASRQKMIMEAEATWMTAKENPDVLDKRKAALNYIRALGSPDADELILPDPEDEEVMPADPLTEYMSLLAARPIKAGLTQNHQAHIDAHAAQMKLLQNSALPVEQGDAVSAMLSAHIAEHMGLQMLVEAASIAGIPIEQLGPQMSPEVEAQIAPALAQAVMQIEEMRRPPDGAGEKAAVEQIKSQAAERRELIKSETKLTESDMKRRHERELAELKHQQQMELQGRKDDAAMDREVEDNTAAITIARMKQSDKNAGADAGANA